MQTPTESLNQNYVTYTHFSTERLTASQPEPKVVPGTGPGSNPPVPAQNYYQIPLLYNYGIDCSRLNDFLLEGPELESSTGIRSSPAPSGNGRLDHAIPVRFDLNDPEQKRFIDVMNSVHKSCAYILGTMKGAVNLRFFDPNNPDGLFSNPVYRPYDKVSNQFIEGRAPSMFLKLFSRGKPGMEEQTLFTGVDGNTIPWALMQGVEMKFIPLIHIKRIYVGSKASLQMEVQSAIVTSIRARNSAPKQLATLQRLQQEKPALVDAVATQVARLTMDRKEQLPQGHQCEQPNQQHCSESNKPTFDGIVPTNTRQPHTHSQESPQTQLPSGIPTLPLIQTVPSIDSLTAGAPSRNNVIPTITVPSVSMGSPNNIISLN